MCRRVTCERCGKPSFAGCGMHVEQVLGDVPAAERCRCAEQARSALPPLASFVANALRTPRNPR